MFIYVIHNKSTQKIYVGKTTRDITARLAEHWYHSREGSSTHLHRSMRRHDKSAFSVSVIEHCNDLQALNEAEMQWISILDPEYNMTEGGDGGDTSWSPNYQLAMKLRDSSGEKNSMYGKRGPLNPNTGTRRTPEQLERIKAGVQEGWNNPDRREAASARVTGDKNPAFGKTPANATPVVFNGVEYESLAADSRATKHTTHYIKKWKQ